MGLSKKYTREERMNIIKQRHKSHKYLSQKWLYIKKILEYIEKKKKQKELVKREIDKISSRFNKTLSGITPKIINKKPVRVRVPIEDMKIDVFAPRAKRASTNACSIASQALVSQNEETRKERELEKEVKEWIKQATEEELQRHRMELDNLESMCDIVSLNQSQENHTMWDVSIMLDSENKLHTDNMKEINNMFDA
jgi:hypothetical protein